jgi:peptidoglycan hydrolase-like protein with peptidoglycan-binding domain
VPSRRHGKTSFDGANERAGIIARYPHEFVGIVMAAVATAAIFVNALFLQRGPHPAPIFAPHPLTKREAALPPHRPQALPTTAAPPAASARNQARLTADIQRELARRGYYDGPVDGLWGAKTLAAARDLLQATGLKLKPEPSEDLLHALAASATKAAGVRPAAPAPTPTRDDPSASAVVTPSKHMLAIQHALAEFGYGQIKPTGVYDQDTRAAIEKFQSDHKLPVDGQVSDDFVRELATMTGRSLE